MNDSDDGAVIILDDLLLPTDVTEQWMDAWRSRYLPGARARGYSLRGIWRGATRDPSTTAVVLHWTTSIDGLWASRAAAAEDPSVEDFWRWTDSLAVARDRRLLAPEERW